MALTTVTICGSRPIQDLEAPKVQRGVGQLRTLLRAVKAYEESILWHPKEGGGDVSQAITLVEEMMKKIGKEPKERANNNRSLYLLSEFMNATDIRHDRSSRTPPSF